MKKIFLTFIFLLPIMGLYACGCDCHEEIEQTIYSVRGFNPYTNTKYTGKAIITRQGEIFSVQWTFDDGTTEIGTGLRSGNKLSISYATADPTLPNPGLQVYEIIGINKLKGPWVPIGGNLVGEEALKRTFF
jgi:hypothetical protein